ncbi:filamentous hemagglutinin N-terminal domain-containing protein [Caballeronia sp. LZ019]|uniref:beta strand repeat-containing protein n=1 Tax=Caballeronia sp. LZ019 TaxID=3038555 RepID=UPI00286299E3|nr:filamentous hemagglutinin N-terminal domain-containing protein [Caballeronia sp. LZ019]MDR5808740.1 filamentous hemagglutinin N-terminal domain-containing protein [Caballeronia sp. LZ019]
MRHSVNRLVSAFATGSAAGHAGARAACFTIRPLSMFIAIACGSFASAAIAAPPLPQGGQFVAGAGSITQSGGNMTITQSGARGVIDWNSFSIASGRTVSINNGTGATLNRVTGNDVSSIYGTLKGTGTVYLINPHGVVVGPRGVVLTGGHFVASTLDISNDDFASGYQATFTGNSNASVVNLGNISSTGGNVYLISANKVMNAGRIEAPEGSANLVAGRSVSLIDTGYDQQIGVAVGSHGTIANAGEVQAALINLQAADGNIFALAGRSAALRATGTATRDGHVWLVADTGSVDARGAQISARNADGTPSGVDMIGRDVKVGGADISAGALNITTGEFTADAATAGTFTSSLNRGTSITVNADGTDGSAGATGKGNIVVPTNLRWNGASSLTLNAAHSVTIAPGVTVANAGSGSLKLYADAHAFNNGGSVTNLGTIDWSRSNGVISVLYDMNGANTPGTVRVNPSWSAAPYSGLVTQYTAYRLVNSIDDLRAVKNDLSGTYALGTSLGLFGATGLGGIGTAATPFTGQFDGMGHLPVGLTLGGGETGLFGVVGASGILRNFVLAGTTATASSGPVGMLVGTNRGYLVNVGASGVITLTGEGSTVAGGLAGENFGRIEQSWAGGNVSGGSAVGGLVGRNDGFIGQSYALGSAAASGQGALGGLVGINNGRVVQSYAQESLTGNGAVGGLVGGNAGGIYESYTTSTLSTGAGARAGGIVGGNRGLIASNVFWNKESSGVASPVGQGAGAPASAGLTDAQLGDTASFGPTWDFSANGAWAMPVGSLSPALRWLYGS